MTVSEVCTDQLTMLLNLTGQARTDHFGANYHMILICLFKSFYIQYFFYVLYLCFVFFFFLRHLSVNVEIYFFLSFLILIVFPHFLFHFFFLFPNSFPALFYLLIYFIIFLYFSLKMTSLQIFFRPKTIASHIPTPTITETGNVDGHFRETNKKSSFPEMRYFLLN